MDFFPSSKLPEAAFVDLSQIRRIGVFKLRNIGDVLITTPVYRALREHFPNAEIVAVVNSVTDSMLYHNPHLDRLIVYDRPARNAPWWKKAASEVAYWSAIRQSRFDLTFDFTRGDRPAFASWISGAKIRVSTYQNWGKTNWRNWAYTHLLPNPYPLPMHEVEQHLWVLSRLGIEAMDKSLCLVVPEAAKLWATGLLQRHRPGPVVHVHPVARWLFKCWNEEKMATVLDWLQEKKKATVIVTASADPAEREVTRSLLARCRKKPLLLAGNISLTQLAALAEQADCFFGVDTAPMHIAAAVGTPVVALFGPTDAPAWHPWSAKQVTLSRHCACAWSPQPVCDWNKTRACIDQIQVSDAQDALNRFLP